MSLRLIVILFCSMNYLLTNEAFAGANGGGPEIEILASSNCLEGAIVIEHDDRDLRDKIILKPRSYLNDDDIVVSVKEIFLSRLDGGNLIAGSNIVIGDSSQRKISFDRDDPSGYVVFSAFDNSGCDVRY